VADLDKIVRPFQIKPNLAAIPEKVQEVRKPGTPITHRSGGHGSAKIITGNYSLNMRNFHEQAVIEQSQKR
jgi:hypothetical protein